MIDDIEEWQWEMAEKMAQECGLPRYEGINLKNPSCIALARMIGKHETKPADPDVELASEIEKDWTNDTHRTFSDALLIAIKRGRELERGQ